MYRLDRSEKTYFQHTSAKTVQSQPQIILHQFQKSDAGLSAYKIYNDKLTHVNTFSTNRAKNNMRELD